MKRRALTEVRTRAATRRLETLLQQTKQVLADAATDLMALAKLLTIRRQSANRHAYRRLHEDHATLLIQSYQLIHQAVVVLVLHQGRVEHLGVRGHAHEPLCPYGRCGFSHFRTARQYDDRRTVRRRR